MPGGARLALAGEGAPAASAQAICRLIETAAEANRLPVGFLARLLWQESRFHTDVTSPVGAQGIAQFMPRTAVERGLGDPLDPPQAIANAARLLIELNRRFGNLGLAAAAYNAGPARIAKWLHGAGDLPVETRLYVQSVTGRRAEDWAVAGNQASAESVAGGSCIAVTERYARAGVIRFAPLPAWATRLDARLSRAIAAAGPAARGEREVVTSNERPYEPRNSIEQVCDSLRGLGAVCAVVDR